MSNANTPAMMAQSMAESLLRENRVLKEHNEHLVRETVKMAADVAAIQRAHDEQKLRLYTEIRSLKALLTVQVYGLRDALEDLLEQFDPRNHQTYCECDPSVGYQCAACKFPSIPAVGAAHDALSALPQSEDVRDSENLLSLIGDIAKVAGRDVPDCVDNDGQPYQSPALDAAIKAAISAQD